MSWIGSTFEVDGTDVPSCVDFLRTLFVVVPSLFIVEELAMISEEKGRHLSTVGVFCLGLMGYRV